MDTGAVRDIYKEVTETYYESGFDAENWQVLHASNEFVWFSERSNWGHLYLGDLTTGEIKAPITTGNWAVLKMLRVDEDQSKAAGTLSPGVRARPGSTSTASD